MLVEFFRGPTRRYRSVLHRADGVAVELEGGAWNDVGGPAGDVPHDIAHLIVEHELRLRWGVWGVLAAGGLFRGASIFSGRQRPHAAERARKILRARGEELNQAEVLVAAVCQLCVRGCADVGALRAATGPRWWSDTASAEALTRAFAQLQELGAAWQALPAGGRLELAWS